MARNRRGAVAGGLWRLFEPVIDAAGDSHRDGPANLGAHSDIHAGARNNTDTIRGTEPARGCRRVDLPTMP